VEGVGPKTAAKLVLEHGSTMALLADPGAVKNEKLRSKLEAAASRVRDNLELVRLDAELPLPSTVAGLTLAPDPAAMVSLAGRCEFRSLLVEYERVVAQVGKPSQAELF